MGCVVMTASAGGTSSAAGAEEIPPSNEEFLPQRPAAAARLARLERVVDIQEQQRWERLARIDRAERMEIDAAIAASSAVAASDAAERMVREVDEGEEAEEEEPMVGKKSAAAEPVHPPDITPMDLAAVRALPRAQRGGCPAPRYDHARWRDPVRQAAVEPWLARSQSPSICTGRRRRGRKQERAATRQWRLSVGGVPDVARGGARRSEACGLCTRKRAAARRRRAGRSR